MKATFTTAKARSAPVGLLEVAGQHKASLVVVGSSAAGALEDLKLSNFSLAGSKRSITCAAHSAAQTLSVSSTYTA